MPVLERVTDCAALVVPRFWPTKVRLEGESETCGAPTPVPLREAEWGEPVALSETVREAVLAPTAEGEKVTEMEQLAPAATEDPQVLVWAKSVPAMEMLEMVRAAVPVLERVMDCAALVVPRF